MEVSNMSGPFFQLLESYNIVENLVSIKSYGYLKMVYRF